MNDKKHIDRLFQEGFKDFEATPSDAVWKNIEDQLNEKKKKRRVIPIWWRYAGVAALLLLLLTIGNFFFNNSDESSTNQVVDSENVIPEYNEVKDNDATNKAVKTNVIVSDDNSQNDSNENSNANTQPEVITDNIESSKETSIAETSASKNQNESKTNLTSSDKLNIKKSIITPRNNNGIANNLSEEKNKAKNIQKELENNITVANSVEEKNESVDAKSEVKLVSKEKAKTLITETSKDNSAIANSDNEKIEELKDKVTTEENNRSIEDVLNKTKDVLEEENSKLGHRWSVATNAAPVYFNSLGEGSSIDPQFSSNSKSGEVNMSYGISASYAINKKLSIRSGINRVNLGYNTNDVAVFQSVGLTSNSSALQNVSSRSNADDISVISTETLKNTPKSFASTNASINQALGYIEIPLEIQYTLSDKKFGVNLIGGFSSFFLNNNEIFSEEDNGARTFLGEANNINDISYSANFGLGLNYKVSKKFDLNLEPIFKYQFNTFNNTSGNFSPFFIGVYTGFAIKF
ncbi:outer membrane beta-barrel protein [uncultured Algibacter sp.]|uniref:outer membrane beta-barrel protein n=1 Tax=uncultured Algibacter sp. TaxID=298659 RepID=UPI00261F5AB8|nr:outer membrane beta-barrel protein [uncultured Algibacter sp.]